MAQEIETRTFFLDPNGIVQSDTAEISPNALAEEPSIHALVGGWPWLTGVPSLLLRAERIFWLECAAAGADLVGVSSECRLVSAEIKAHNQAQRDNEAGNPTLSGRLMAVPQVLRGLRKLDTEVAGRASFCPFKVRTNPDLVGCVVWDMFVSDEGARRPKFWAVGDEIVAEFERYVANPRNTALIWSEKSDPTKTRDWVAGLKRPISRPISLVLVALAAGSIDGRCAVQAWYRHETIRPAG